MDYYKWHKGDELPTEECDCVVVFREIIKFHRRPGTVMVIRKQIGQCIFDGHEYLIVNNDNGLIPQENTVAWLPIKFPEESLEQEGRG